MRIGFVVLTYNRSDALLAVLRALAPQCAQQDVVVVADDGSRPEHVQALRSGLPRFGCAVRHVWHPDTGFTAARARNLGALHANADYIVFLDGDCVPNPRFARRHRSLAEPRAFVNGSRVLLGRGLSARVCAAQLELPALDTADWLRLWLRGEANKPLPLLQWPAAPGRRRRRFEWKGIRSCNFGVWWSDLQAVNGFDESFSGWGHEDADLVLRLHHAGLVRKNGYLATEVFHLWHPENSRADEGRNRDRVTQRMAGRQVRADVGIAEAGNQTGVLVTELVACQQQGKATA